MSTKTSSELNAAFLERFGDRVAFNEPLGPYLAYGVGGPADILIFPKTESELDWVTEVARTNRLAITVIGTGTNLLVVDEGLRGITISLLNAFDEIRTVDRTKDSARVRVGGGVPKPAFLEWSIQEGLGGLEFSAGVPGTIGGGIFMNAGTKYGSYGDILERLRVFDFHSGGKSLTRKDFHFGYREQSAVRDSLVTEAEFILTPTETEAIRKEVDRIIEERALKQPLQYPSCGSTFKNPPGHSAGRLIEKAGLKGLRIGGAEISLKHANFILNKDAATAADITAIHKIIQREVKDQFGIDLECEVVTLGPAGRLVLEPNSVK